MAWIKTPKGVSRRFQRLLKCVIALTGSVGNLSSAVGRTGGAHKDALFLGRQNPGIPGLALVGNAVVQPRHKLPWSNRRQGREQMSKRGRRLLAGGSDGRCGAERNARGGYVGGDSTKQHGGAGGLFRPAATRHPTARRRRRLGCMKLASQAQGTTAKTATDRKYSGPYRPSTRSTRNTANTNTNANNRGASHSMPPSSISSNPDRTRPRVTQAPPDINHPAFIQALASSAGALLRPADAQGIRLTKRNGSRTPMATGWRAFLWSVWRGLMAIEGWCESSWGGRACAHVVAGALASSHSVVGSVIVGLALWVSCAKRLGQGGKDSWKQVVRVSTEVGFLWYCHALPHGLGAGRPLRGNFGSGKAGDLLGAIWHFLGQGVFIRLVAASSRLVGVNVLEANGILLGMSCLGNAVAGSRMRCLASTASGGNASDVCTYQLRGFFSRTKGIFRERPMLSFAFDAADTLLALQGILSATEREVVRPNGVAAMAFRDFAGHAANTLDAHSLGALGARNLMGMGFVRARVRMFGRPALSLGWTEKAHNMCMVGDPICGSLLQKLLDPTCIMLKGKGHFYDAYVACVGCLESIGS